MPSSYVKSIAVDNNNHLWIGTVQGLRVLYNTSNFFDASVVTTQKIVILEDGIPRELLEQQYITDIEVDGANNKWVGTIGSGVFYFSPNGQQTIYHFTKENSPLPSNNINDISVNSVNGKVYFATDRGLVSFNTGSSSSSENFSNVFVSQYVGQVFIIFWHDLYIRRSPGPSPIFLPKFYRHLGQYLQFPERKAYKKLTRNKRLA